MSTVPTRLLATFLVLTALMLTTVVGARAGSTEPDLALTDATTSLEDGVVTLETLANFDYGNYTRLGYPLELVLTQGGTVARLDLAGTVTVTVGGGAPVPQPGASGVIAIERASIIAVIPVAITAGGTSATLHLEATFDETTLNSNAIEVTW